MKTLLVHYSDDDTIKKLCKKSAARDIDTLELHEISGSSQIKRRFDALRGAYTRVGSYDVDVNSYDTVILASDECFGGIYPAMNTFIHNNDLRFKDVICLVFGEGRLAKRAGDALRMQVSLSGGTPRCVVTIPVRNFKQYDEDVLYYVRHKLYV